MSATILPFTPPTRVKARPLSPERVADLCHEFRQRASVLIESETDHFWHSLQLHRLHGNTRFLPLLIKWCLYEMGRDVLPNNDMKARLFWAQQRLSIPAADIDAQLLMQRHFPSDIAKEFLPRELCTHEQWKSMSTQGYRHLSKLIGTQIK